MIPLRSIVKKGVHMTALQPLPPLELIEFDHEGAGHDLATEPLDKLAACRRGASGRNQVVDEHDAVARFDSVDVRFQRSGAVFELVRDRLHVIGQLSRLSQRYESGVQLPRGKRPEQAPRR